MLTRNVNYEVPALKKQVVKCKKAQQDCAKKESEYNSLATDLKLKYTEMCLRIGIEVSEHCDSGFSFVEGLEGIHSCWVMSLRLGDFTKVR